MYERIRATRAAEILGVDVRSVQRLAQRAKIPAARVGGVWTFDEAQLRAWLTQQEIETCRRAAEAEVASSRRGATGAANRRLQPLGHGSVGNSVDHASPCRQPASAIGGMGENKTVPRRHNETAQGERMTTLYLDTEFNGFKGPLISMALVSPDGDEWYQVVECEGEIDPWVAENVMPKLGKAAISKAEFRVRLHKFIRQFDDPLIVCDWHADLMHFFEAFHGADYRDSLDFRCRTLLLSGASDVRPIAPHNALSDACALRDCFDGRHPI